MATLALDTVFTPIGDPSVGSGTITVETADIDVYEINSDTEPADETEMILTQTLAFGALYEYGKPAKWLLFKSAGAAVIKENGLIRFKG